MDDDTMVESSFSATINAPIERVDIPSWCFTLRASEYQACSPAHYSTAGATTAPDSRRMSRYASAIVTAREAVESMGSILAT
jgi:hypothetical protein